MNHYRFNSHHLNMVVRSFILSGLLCTLIGAPKDFGFMVQVASAESSNFSEVQEAQNLMIEGRKMLAQSKFRRALDLFKRAHRLVPDVKTAVIIGAIYVKLDRCVDAFKSWQDGLKLCGACGKAEEIRDKLHRYTSQCASSIRVESTPRAQVAINQKFVGDTPYQGMILRGKHEIQVSALGYQTRRVIRIAKPPQPLSERLDLSPEGRLLGAPRGQQLLPPPPLPPPPPPSLTIMNPTAVTPSFQEDPQGNQLHGNLELKARNRRIRNGLWISSLALGLGAGGITIWTESEFKALQKRSKSNSMAKDDLYTRSTKAGGWQTTARVMGVFSGVALITSFFFLD